MSNNIAKLFQPSLSRPSKGEIRNHATRAQKCAPPPASDDYAALSAVTRIVAPYKRAQPAVWRAHLIQHLILAIVLLGLAYGLWTQTDWSFRMLLVLCCLAGALTALYQLLFKKYAEPINEDRHNNAALRLEEAGDPKSSISPLWLVLGVVGMMGDGYFFSTALIPLLEDVLTPVQLGFFQVAVSVFVAVALGTASFFAAKEAASADRKALIRRLRASGAPADQERASIMSQRLERTLGRDFDRRHPVTARVALILFVFTLIAAHCYARLAHEPVPDAQVVLVEARAFPISAEEAGDIALPDEPMPTTAPPHTSEPTPAPTEKKGPSQGSIILSITLAAVLLVTVWTFFNKLRESMCLSKNAAEDAQILARFSTVDELRAFHDQHRDTLRSMLQEDLAIFGDDLGRALDDGDPLIAAKWPPYKAPDAQALLR